jgi:hypothetical protein
MFDYKIELYTLKRGKCLQRESTRVDGDQDYTNPSKV